MNAALACAALEIRRGRGALRAGVGIAALVGLLNATHRFDSDHPVTILLIVLPAMAALGVSFLPLATLTGDRLSGRLGLERALPLPWPVIAAARLGGAGVRTLVAPLLLLAVLVGVIRHADFAPSWRAGLTIIAGLWMILTMSCWLVMAANARWSLIRLWWVPTTLWFAPQLMPEAWTDAIMQALRPIGEWVLAEASRADGSFRLLAPLVLAFLVTAVSAAFLYASGLRRYVHDPDPLGLIGKRDRMVVALEYPRARKSAFLALTLLDIRLGVELLVKRWIVIAALVVIALIGPGELREMAPVYIRILGAMVPGAVVVGILAGRKSGAIALLQHLPRPHWLIAAGKLASILVLSLLGAGVISAARAVDGSPAVPTVEEIARLTMLVAGGVWMGAVLAMWWRRRYFYWLGPVVLAAGTGLAFMRDSMAKGVVGAIGLVQAPTGALLTFALVAFVGIPLFAHGLARYQKS